MTDPDRPAGLTDAVLREQLALLASHLRGIIVGTFLSGLILSIAVATSLELRWPWVWLAALTLISVLRYAVLRAHETSGAPAHPRRRHALLLALSCLSASHWGLFGWLAVTPEAPIASLMVTMVLIGLVASATGFISHLRTMYVFYTGLMLLPAVARFLAFEQYEFRLIGAMLVLYALVSFVTARATRDAVLNTIRLRFRNLDLVADLQAETIRSNLARERAERANHAKSLFLAAASHDLRQPLHSLRLFTATLAHQLAAPVDRRADARRLVGRMDASVNALDGLFESILDISRLDAGTLVPEREHVDLDRLLERALDGIAADAGAKGLTVLAPAAHDSPRIVHTDPVLLTRLLGNLLSNAVRYTPAGSVGIRVSKTADGTSAGIAGWRLEVVDTGIGIDAADRERVFEEFVQLGNPERDRTRGIGLGLSIVARIASLLELELECRSSPGEGTAFALALPAGAPERVLPDPAAARPAQPGALDGRLVLIVDDEADVRDALEGMIDAWGGDAVAVASAAEAVATLVEIERLPDIVVSDWRLRGGETGADAIAAVRRHAGSELPAIVITGDVAALRLRAIADSGLVCLHKPCDPERLRRALLHALASTANDAAA